MRKAFVLFMLLASVFSLIAQTKKVAVMETKNIQGVSDFQSNMVRGGMEVAVANANGYEGYDRAAFDMILQEHNFQRSGAVDDKQIREMGIMAGVQYVLVTEASTDGQGFFILAKLLDVETGKYGNAVNSFCNASGQDIFKASNELGAQLFGGSQKEMDYESIAKKGDDYYDVGNYEEALKCYRLAAEHGSAVGQNGMGRLYNGGFSVKQDYVEAAKWFRKSATQGNNKGQYNLGVCYDKGHGVIQDYSEAVKWFRKSAEQGNSNAQYALGSCYYQGNGINQDLSEALKWFRESASQGNSYAQCYIGVMYSNGYGVTQDYSEALKWIRKSVNQDNEIAQCQLAAMYHDGLGVIQDYSEALKWFRKAADQGFEVGQYFLGWMYEYGEGVDESIMEAKKWYRKAAAQGNESAIEALNRLK